MDEFKEDEDNVTDGDGLSQSGSDSVPEGSLDELTEFKDKVDELYESVSGFASLESGDVSVGSVSPEQVLYLLRKCPFVQVVTGGGAEPQDDVTLITAESSNWPICYYGDAMSTSPGPYVIGSGAFRVSMGDDDEGDGGSGLLNPGKGTMINQAFLTCYDMVQIALKNGWKSIHVVDGTRIMGRGLWIHGEREGLIVTGFEPNEQDLRAEYLVNASIDDLRARYTSVSSGPGQK